VTAAKENQLCKSIECKETKRLTKLLSDHIKNATCDNKDCCSSNHNLEVLSEQIQAKFSKNAEKNSRLSQSADATSYSIGVIAHQLNNLLAGIKGYAEIATMQKDSLADSTAKHLGKIKGLSSRMESSIRHLRAFSNRGNEKKVESINVYELINQALERFSKVFLEKNTVTYEINCPKDYVMEGNRKGLKNVFENLIANSCEAYERNSQSEMKIVITVESTENKRLKIIYEDDAGGMPTSVELNVFDPFFTTKEDTVGSGLGLPIAKKIIGEHSGSININPETRQGVVITIELPIQSEG